MVDEVRIRFREDFRLWWPMYDHNPEACHSRVIRRVTDLQAAISVCRTHDVAVQAGGHAGVWPLFLARHFNHVHTFEPDPILFQCLVRNVDNALVPDHVKGILSHYSYALGSSCRSAAMRRHISAGSWCVDDEVGDVPVDMVTIDSLQLPSCSLIQLDVEGYEPEVLRGAVDTINEYHPVIMVEMLDRSAKDIRSMLASLNYRWHANAHKDSVYVPR